MQTAQPGDRVQVRYVKRFQDGPPGLLGGPVPLELTVGVAHPRLPGLGLALVGMAPGASTTVRVTPEEAYGLSDPALVRRWARSRFPVDQLLEVGKWVPVRNRQGRRRLVRILEVRDKLVVVDTNRRGAGQVLELKVKLVGIGPNADARPGSAPRPPGKNPWRENGGEG